MKRRPVTTFEKAQLMKSILPLVSFLILLLPPCSAAASGKPDDPVRFDDHFLDKALRVDVLHVGSHDFERVCITVLKEEKHYSGPRERLAEAPDLGIYRFELRDPESGRIIFRRGYCGLFNEWRTTAEARAGVWRALEHTLVAPYPKHPVVLSIAKRVDHPEATTWEEVLRQDISMEERFISKDNSFPDARCKPLMVNGNPADKVDLLILGDGYSTKEGGKFDQDAKKVFKSVFSVEPYKKRRRDFNVWTVRTPSPASGVDQPRKGEFVPTALGVTFNFFDLARYSLTYELHTMHDAAAHAPHDVILLIFNEERMGGGGIYNLYAVCSADSAVATQVLIHELGHALAGLGDEYYTAEVSYIDYYPDGVEPWEPNITAMLDPRQIKWQHLITKGAPIPTPKLPKFRETVGCFEGAGYRAKGLYRPCLDCVMFSLNTSEHCPVCYEAVERAIDFYTGGSR